MKKRQVVVKKDSSSGRSSTTSSSVVRTRYAECQKNHAANIGGYALDGCREFMASGEDGSNAALSCAACGCHRNFHRREVETEVVYLTLLQRENQPLSLVLLILKILRNQTSGD